MSIGSVPDHWGNDYFDDTYIRNGKPETFKGYCTDVFFDEAKAFIKRSVESKKPFMAYIVPNTPHGPLIAKEEDEAAITEILAGPEFAEMRRGIKKELAKYLGMVRNIDMNMGRLVAFLAEEGLLDNTILVFMTDNGSTFGPRYFNAGMRGQKTELWEGGHRVPLFISWPNGGFTKPRTIGGLNTGIDSFSPMADGTRLSRS